MKAASAQRNSGRREVTRLVESGAIERGAGSMQVPAPLQTPVGHGDPAAALPVGAHTGAPLEQAMAPVVHALPVLHVIPAIHALQTPVPLQTPPVQSVPAAAFPVVAHTGAPLEQTIAPVVHALPVLHVMPAIHALQTPVPLQTPPAHGDPAAVFPVVAHTGAPLEQTIAPVVHALPVLHVMPAVHALQTPAPLQTPPAHGAPAAVFPVAMHTGAPLAHDVVPVVHALPVLHTAPGTQALQVPVPLHTPPAHGDPAGVLPVGLQTRTPVVHEAVPVVQALPVLHAAPDVQAVQVPAAVQTPPAHGVPGAELPLTAHTGAPLVHAIDPVVHAMPVTQDIPSVHALQMPVPLQTPPAHGTPAGSLPVILHTGVPLEHSVRPISHGLPVVHAAASAHAPQVPPAAHTSPAPHGVPAGAGPLSTQSGTPVAHEIVPVWHGVPGAHAVPTPASSHGLATSLASVASGSCIASVRSVTSTTMSGVPSSRSDPMSARASAGPTWQKMLVGFSPAGQSCVPQPASKTTADKHANTNE